MTSSNLKPTTNGEELNDRLADIECGIEILKDGRADLQVKLEEVAESIHLNPTSTLEGINRLTDCIQEKYQRLEMLLHKILEAQIPGSNLTTPSHAETTTPSVHHQALPRTTHELVSKSRLTKVPTFNGMASRIILWLDEIALWPQKLGLDGLDDLLLEPGPLLANFLEGSALTWFRSRHTEKPFSSFMDFQKGLLEHTFGYDWTLDLEKSMEKQATLERYKVLIEYLERCDILANFLARGKMSIVNQMIIEINDDASGFSLSDVRIIEALVLAFNKNQHDRIISLFKSVEERHALEDEQRIQVGAIPEFELFMDKFIKRFVHEESSMPVKRFLTLRCEELKREFLRLFEVFCLSLAYFLRSRLDDPDIKKFLLDLIGQPSLLPTNSFVKAFLGYNNGGDIYRVNFIKYCWREAMAEGLKEVYPMGGGELWDVLLRMFPGQFPRQFPPSTETLTAVLMKFPTKQGLEEDWVKENAPKLLNRVEMFVPGLPTLPLKIVSKYSVTWLDT